MGFIVMFPVYNMGRKDKLFLIDRRTIALRILIGFACFGAALFLTGVVSFGLALMTTAPLCEYFIWDRLYKRFIRIHSREPRDMFHNMDISSSNDPDRFYAFAIFFSTVFPPMLIPIAIDRIIPIIL